MYSSPGAMCLTIMLLEKFCQLTGVQSPAKGAIDSERLTVELEMAIM